MTAVQRRFAFLLAAALLGGGHSLGAAEQEPAPSSAPASPAATVDSLRQQDIALDLGGLATWAEGFAADGRLIRRGAPVIEGVDAIREHLAAWRAALVGIKWEPRAAEVSAAGDLGFTRGVLTRTLPSADGYETWSGTYVRIWRFEGDGSWKILVDIANLRPGLGG